MILNDFLEQILDRHGIATRTEGEWVYLPEHGLAVSAQARMVRDTPTAMAQLDVRIKIGPGRIILESFAGVGANGNDAIIDALGMFTANSLHVILAALCHTGEEQVTREEWVIGGRKRRVTVGDFGVRGKPPSAAVENPEWFRLLRKRLTEWEIPEGTHWIRLFHMQQGADAPVHELLLDNEVWTEPQAESSAFPWPPGESFYTLRLFMIIEDGVDIYRAMESLVRMEEADAAQIMRDMMAKGIPQQEAEQIVTLLPLAFGRVMMDQLPVTFPETATIQDSRTDATREIRLADQRFFALGRRLAEATYTDGIMTQEEFAAIASRSPEVYAVNQALHGGADPNDLVASPLTIFWIADTTFRQESAGIEISRNAPKPWWRFWE